MPADFAVLDIWLAGIQVVVGMLTLVSGLLARGRPGEILAPLGAMLLISGSSRFLSGVVADEILIPTRVVLFAAVAVWWIRDYRALRARSRELLRPRSQAHP